MKFSEFLSNKNSINEATQHQEIDKIILGHLDKEIGNWDDDVYYDVSKDGKKVTIENLSGQPKIEKVITTICKEIKKKFKNVTFDCDCDVC